MDRSGSHCNAKCELSVLAKLTIRSLHTPFALYPPHTLLASFHLPTRSMNSLINSSNTLTALHPNDVLAPRHPQMKMDGLIHGKRLDASYSDSRLPKVRSLTVRQRTAKLQGTKGSIGPDSNVWIRWISWTRMKRMSTTRTRSDVH